MRKLLLRKVGKLSKIRKPGKGTVRLDHFPLFLISRPWGSIYSHVGCCLNWKKKTRISQDYDICWYSLISFRSKTKNRILGSALINTAMCFSKVECLKKKNLLGPDTCVLSCFSRIQLFAVLWTAASQAPLSTRFSRQEHCSGCHFLLHGIAPTQDRTGISYVSCIGRGILYH